MADQNTAKNGSFEDIQEALRTSELRYRRLFETAKDGILILDAETGRIMDVNPFLVDLLGVPHEQFMNKPVWDVGFFRDIVADGAKFSALREAKIVRHDDVALETADGRTIDVEFVSNVYMENHQSVIQWNIRDISSRKRASDQIAAERERLYITLRSIGDGVIATDAHGNIENMNSVAEELCGWSLKESMGKPLFSVFNIINEFTRAPHDNPVEKVLKTGKVVELANHTVIISKSGVERVIADSASPIRDRNNHIIGVVLVFRDITEKMKLLETTQRNQKLESLGLLAAGIAHDFNNLLGGIYGFLYLAQAESTEQKVLKYLSSSINTIHRSKSLTNQLLTFATGGTPITRVTPLPQLIQDTIHFALSGSNVSVRFDISQGLWPCKIDKSQICQVLENIVINAQQAMPAGGTVTIKAANITIDTEEHGILSNGRYVKISVGDTGIGISKKNLPRIFDPFFTTKPKGHGLGLAISHSIINRHCGVIDVESVLDVGSTFHVYLPATTELPEKESDLPVRHQGTGRIVVMDDEPVIQETISAILGKFGYEVICKKDGKETIDFFNAEYGANKFMAALFLDLTIPGGIGGKAVADEIRKIDARVPLVVMSGYSEDPILHDPVSYGFTASISKPFSLNELSRLLNSILGHQRA